MLGDADHSSRMRVAHSFGENGTKPGGTGISLRSNTSRPVLIEIWGVWAKAKRILSILVTCIKRTAVLKTIAGSRCSLCLEACRE